MEGRQPKRRKDKYNPYEIYEKDGKYYVSFRNGEKEYKDLEIGKNVYEAFNTFELQDVSHMNVVDRHIEQSEVWDSSLYERIFQKEESVEDTVLNKLDTERLHSAIQQLSEIQRRRLMNVYEFVKVLPAPQSFRDKRRNRWIKIFLFPPVSSLKRYFSTHYLKIFFKFLIAAFTDFATI